MGNHHQTQKQAITLEEYLAQIDEKRRERMAEIKEKWETMTPEEKKK
jgi:hypothetical protein